ncbi:YhdP family protein [Marilutibacter alkalisoli]|uniref:TIGR02099 family protein n=1 Tax=Marilutibacter alkalisoli TaxID=2591633 RepID=A0A514BTE0_9GAMM|nr:YhdP family protein [Lysobacter alkalisoli]QDH70652.1 TIGR02099 family protein [Lysobacter alkalisoli]
MPTPLRRRLRLARRGAVYTAAIVLVLVAVLLGIASRLLPLAEQHPERIQAWLSERTGRPVAFDRVETDWTRRGPLLKLDNLRIGGDGADGAGAVTVGDAEMLVSIYAGLLPGRALSELRLRGLDLTLERGDDGRWQVRGLPGQERDDGDVLGTLESLGELQVVDGKLAVVAPAFGIDTHIPRIDLRLQVSGELVRAAARAWPRLGGDPLDAVVSFERKSGDGQAYAGARQADLAEWQSLLELAGVQVRSGRGRAEAWAELHGNRITAVTVNAALDGVALASADPDAAGSDDSMVEFNRVEARARWQATAGDWRLDAPVLRIDSDDAPQVLDGLTMVGGRRYGLFADRVDIAPLLEAAALSDRLAPGLREWMREARPQGVVHEIRISGERDGPVQANARIEGIGFQPVRSRPGLSGVAGMFEGDASGFVLRLDRDSPMRFDWPTGFGVVHEVVLDGDVSGWREGDGWKVATGGLRVDGGSFATDVRGGLHWPGDGSRPRIDMAATLDDVQVPVAKGFWVRDQMPESAVEWLDKALEGGIVRDGRAVISGDLDDWPFRGNTGLFEATGRIEQGVVRFQPDWPAVEDLQAEVSFVADGFDVRGSGAIAGVGIGRIEAGIDHYDGGRLQVRADGRGDASQLLELLRQSPLNDSLGDDLAAIEAGGPARVGFGLHLPLQEGDGLRIDGTVDLADARLADPRWELAFDQVSGRAHYSRNGFEAEALSVRHEGLPGTLSLRAGDGHVRNAGNAFEAGLQSSVPASELVRRVPDLAWLGPYLSGRSDWNVGVNVPEARDGQETVSWLRLDSDLTGTGLDLPAPMTKPLDLALATTVETPLPLGSGDIRVTLGERMAVRARAGDNATGVRIVLGATRVDEPPPVNGLVVNGHAGQLDAMDWIALSRVGTGEGTMPLRRIDVTASDLRLLGGSFPDTRVVVAPAAAGVLEVDTSGESLQGRLSIPAAASETIAGRFERVHWRLPETAVAAVQDPAAPVVGPGLEDTLDPAAIPPLAIDVDEFRLNDAALGQAVFRSQPTAAGMHIERLETRARRQQIDVSGDWTGTGGAARTRLALELRSEDFGRLVDGLGLGLTGRIGDGKGKLNFAGTWPGNPAAFSAAALDGRLTVAVRDGQLLEVEPGAGRVLGLLSIAQLPRRLMLDFGDFFNKGFAFNQAGGSVMFDDGQARSDGLLIDGPSAAIAIRGTTDLRGEQFDQTIEVRPKAGNLLTAVGALAGGPMGAAIGAAANVVLEKPLGQVAAKTYRVTGPWKDPKVEVQTREQGRASTVVEVPAG